MQTNSSLLIGTAGATGGRVDNAVEHAERLVPFREAIARRTAI